MSRAVRVGLRSLVTLVNLSFWVSKLLVYLMSLFLSLYCRSSFGEVVSVLSGFVFGLKSCSLLRGSLCVCSCVLCVLVGCGLPLCVALPAGWLWLALVGFGCGLVDWLGLILSAWRSLVGAWFSCW